MELSSFISKLELTPIYNRYACELSSVSISFTIDDYGKFIWGYLWRDLGR